jgi:hypothetical protein
LLRGKIKREGRESMPFTLCTHCNRVVEPEVVDSPGGLGKEEHCPSCKKFLYPVDNNSKMAEVAGYRLRDYGYIAPRYAGRTI